ncbi:MAG: hypothetical protein YK1309IOTA_660010 [Marine Group I thaumarchaeote]|nr:MAG: hypothetical protein YK1309IOTA_660010 [Marine Group I thaumarchaeote]
MCLSSRHSSKEQDFSLLNLSIDPKWRGEWDLNPRVLANMGLAIPRPTKLGDPRSQVLQLKSNLILLEH